MGVAVEVCPHCSGEFTVRTHLSVDDVALLMRVTRSAVHKWMAAGLLKFHLNTPRGRSLKRVVFAEDYYSFRFKHFPLPDQLVPGTLAHRLWTRQQRIVHLAGNAAGIVRRAQAAARRAKLAAQQSELNNPSSSPLDPSLSDKQQPTPASDQGTPLDPPLSKNK
jgi:hypothetical protein